MTIWILENLLVVLSIFCLSISLMIINLFVLCRFIKKIEPTAGQVYMTIFCSISGIGFTGLTKLLTT